MGIGDIITSLLPGANDVLAGAVIVLSYTVRISAATNGADPWLGLILMTDVIIPGLAVAWVFVMSMYSGYVALGEP